MAKTLTKDDLNFKDPRQRELMRVILADFVEYARREQHYYGLEGMSTSHIVVHALQDFTTLQAFWPPELIHRTAFNTNYQLTPDVMSRIQTQVRKDLDKLVSQGYMEKIGNEHERRWRPVKALKGVTL